MPTLGRQQEENDVKKSHKQKLELRLLSQNLDFVLGLI